MSLATMIAEMRGVVPGYSALLARTHLRECWREVRNMRGWSFQLGQGGFTTPFKINQGTAAVTFGLPIVTFDATASAAIISLGSQYGSLLTQRQFRVGASTIYNIISADLATDPTAVTITLDRPWSDVLTTGGPVPPTMSAIGYTIYQCYYQTPVKGFQAWESMLDVVNVIWLNTSPSKGERDRINRADPQRQIFSNPGTLLSVGADARPGSSTLGWMMYELYPQPQAAYSYQTWYSWDGPELTLPTDILPHPISEDYLKAKARVKAYEWAEANRDPANPRGAGSDYRFLIGVAEESAGRMYKEIRSLDRDLVDMWKYTFSRLSGLGPQATYDPVNATVQARNT